MRHSQRKQRVNRLPGLSLRRHPLTLLADLLIEAPIAADLGRVSCLRLLGTSVNPQAPEENPDGCGISVYNAKVRAIIRGGEDVRTGALEATLTVA